MRRIVFILAVVASAASLASAQPTGRADRFRERDTNRDGVLTEREYGGHPGNFAWLDRDRNGVLSREEFVNRQRGANDSVDAFDLADDNDNGVIDRAEWTEDRDQFTLRDTDRNGVITRDEFNAAVAVPGRGGFPGRGGLRREFRHLDLDNDRRLSRTEWRDALSGFYGRDRDGNGYLSPDEFLADPLPIDPNTPMGRFIAMDRNRDGRLARTEWRDSHLFFQARDRNRDGILTLEEYLRAIDPNSPQGRFEAMDRNHDGVLSRPEWSTQTVAFHHADRDSNGAVTWSEYSRMPAATPREARFDVLDRNNDGVVTRGEWVNENVEFATMDRNRDGAVTLDEFLNPGPGVIKEARFEEWDHNDDGVLSRYEWHSDMARFNRLDANNDGIVTESEFYRELPADTRDARFEQFDRDNDGTIGRSEWPADRESFNILDRSRDGQISRWEFMNPNGLYARFDYLDDDNDGYLSRDEWNATQDAWRLVDRNNDGRVSRDEFVM